MADQIEEALSVDTRARLATAVGSVTTGDGSLPPPPAPVRAKVPRMKDFSIDVTYNGERFVGPFTNSILTVGQHIQRGAGAAILGGGQPYEALDPYTRAYNEKVAHLNLSLVKRPDWFRDIAGILYPELIDAVYEEVAAHERSFRGLDQDV